VSETVSLQSLRKAGLIEACPYCVAVRELLDQAEQVFLTAGSACATTTPRPWRHGVQCVHCENREWVITGAGAALRDMLIESPLKVPVLSEEIPF
jgi:glutaredoxin